MLLIEIDTTRVKWPMTPSVGLAMRKRILRAAKEQGYTYFMTKSFRCLNGIESPDPDPPAPEGWTQIDFFSDCEPDVVSNESAVYQDVVLYAKR